MCYGYEFKHFSNAVADGDCPDETESSADATNCKAGCELWLVPNVYLQAGSINGFFKKYRCTLSSMAHGASLSPPGLTYTGDPPSG